MAEMSDCLTEAYTVKSTDVTIMRTMRLSTLLKLSQEATVKHTTLLGMGREFTLDKGLLWVITQQELKINRLPAYDEKITIKTRPGRQLHLFFPRYTEFISNGLVLVEVKTLWILIDEKTRKAVFPDRYNIHIEGESAPGDFPLPRIKSPSGDPEIQNDSKALYSECDINGHINNSRYFDICDDLMKKEDHENFSHDFRLRAEYSEEILIDNDYRSELFRSNDGSILFQGISDGKNMFRILYSKN